jgi:hypothetical protein
MKNLHIVLCCICLIFNAVPLFPQTEDEQAAEIPASVIERCLRTDAERSSTSYEEFMQTWDETPIDLNTASQDELLRIPGMTPLLAKNIIERRAVRPFLELSDIAQVDGMTSEMLPMLTRNMVFSTSGAGRAAQGSLRQTLFRNLQESAGFLDGKFLGDPYAFRSKLTARIKPQASWSSVCSELRIGITSEKDAGERLANGFTGGYCLASFPAVSSSLLLGDYTAGAGQGLVLWHYQGFAKAGEETSSIRKNSGEIHSSLSTNENLHLRGCAADVALHDIHVQIFASCKPLNAHIDSNSVIQSIEESGSFRTESDVRNWHSSTEHLYGFCAETNPAEKLRCGLCGYRVIYDNPCVLSDTAGGPRTSIAAAGFNAAYSSSIYDAFGECACDAEKRTAFLGGVQIRPSSVLLISILGRHYSENYESPYGNAFSESSGGKEESGIYMGFLWTAKKQIRILSFYDQFVCGAVSKGMRYDNTGYDCMAGAEWDIRRNCEIDIRCESKRIRALDQTEDLNSREIDFIAPRVQNNYQIDMLWHFSHRIETTTRIGCVSVDYSGEAKSESGILLLQDVGGKPFPGFTMNIRFAFFHTSSYDSRLYVYEADLPSASSSTALYGEGFRWYLIAGVEIFPKALLSVKYLQLKKNFVDSIGSGHDKIDGSVFRQIGIQFDYSI